MSRTYWRVKYDRLEYRVFYDGGTYSFWRGELWTEKELCNLYRKWGMPLTWAWFEKVEVKHITRGFPPTFKDRGKRYVSGASWLRVIG